MNYSSLPSAELWEKEEIGKDSEFVYRSRISCGLQGSYNKITINSRNKPGAGCIIGPAMVSDEMEVYLSSKDLFVYRATEAHFELEDDGGAKLEDLWDCKTLTEAYEKAINWYLKEK